MNRLLASALLTLASIPAIAADTPSPQDLLTSTIARHDPNGEWAASAYRMVIRETRPDGRSSDTTILVDNRAGLFRTTSMRDGDMVVGSIDSNGCTFLVNGTPDFPDEVRELHRLTCDRLERIRNYYTYLWGLPMKLRDPGTALGDSVVGKEFEGKTALELRVTYAEGVGSDVWYFYFDPASHDLIGYRFYHDEAAGDGEYITLDGIVEGAGLRLPKTRSWHTHKENEHLGTDTLVSIERP
jgi:hypothetical protein